MEVRALSGPLVSGVYRVTVRGEGVVRMHRPRLKRGAGQDVGDEVGVPCHESGVEVDLGGEEPGTVGGLEQVR